MVLVPVGHMNENNSQNWAWLEARARHTVIDRLTKLGVKDLEKRITFEAKWGPPYYRNALNLMKGSAFGLSHNFAQVGYLRPHNRHARFGNLYFTGASTHPGTGLPIVLLSAQLTTERILAEQVVPSQKSFQISKQLMERA